MWLKVVASIVAELLNLGETINEITPWEEDSDAQIDLQHDFYLQIADDGCVILHQWDEKEEGCMDIGMWLNGYTNRTTIAKRVCELMKEAESKKIIETSK